jgi:two-component system phosphate regulon sensor histidine kinase PhoR
MKKIFPIISILVFISLLGVIFSQILWIKQSLKTKQQQFEETLLMATAKAGDDLIAEKGNLSPFDNRKGTDLLFPLNVFSSSIAHKFTREQLRDRIQKVFEKSNLRNVDFEFAITTTSMIGDELQSKHFYELYQDSAHNNTIVYPLDSPSGSLAEGLSPQELLIIVVPHVKDIIWKQMYWMVIVAVIFTFIIFAEFFITIRELLNQKKLS